MRDGTHPRGCSSKAFIRRAQWLAPVIPALWEAKGLTLLSRLKCSDLIMDQCILNLLGSDFLREHGLLVSRSKLQFVEPEQLPY
ncbi:uncharacterized protein ZNF561-AS1-like [Pongo pygmaeus]|uniref:uncharacterized protein ZNF561-AS1-like n=1 Tax=Pongo pygmaeus TaxID=9600 RepID=UPI00300D5E7E